MGDRCTVIIGLALVLMASSTGIAKPAAESAESDVDRGPVSAILGDLTWGATETEVLKDAEARLEQEWASQRKNLDTLGMDELRRKTRKQLKEIRASLTRFDGTKSAFASSVVGNEYQDNRNESLLIQKIGGQSRYYFFRDRSLWKVVAVMDASRTKGLEQFSAEIARDFGKSTARTFRPEAGQKVLDTVTWTGRETVATAVDRRGVFNAYVVRFVQVGRGEGIQAELDKRPVSKKAEDEMLTDLFDGEDLGASQAEPSLVDELTGESHEVDLKRGVVQEE